ncbi:MAG: hypothetical protein A2Z21_08015 [Candidatus Fraserbacteria bacterium RBG_16_55_9]|uniref:Outer membrane protein beta-barrel domain-containing protein n=1 Tax=Fraserbacteria sp. (strain RBG_16_55_9) TaxID=1817864 RepID=A0A1F5UNJ7_FRAXR|nr:MAG: hypothetical protein A2Z21_08015 [Candidatus Fraserbacteria bacterium RBG_16_55_9]
MTRGAVVAATGFVVVLLFSLNAQAVEFSLGGEFTHGIGVQNVLIVHSGPFGVHIGGGLDSQGIEGREFQSAVFGAYGSFLLKYYIAFDGFPLSMYIGAGFVGAIIDMNATAENEIVALVNGAEIGQQVVAGLELGAPNRLVALYAGLTYVDIPELPMTLFGQTTHVPIAARGITFHMGARLDFRF